MDPKDNTKVITPIFPSNFADGIPQTMYLFDQVVIVLPIVSVLYARLKFLKILNSISRFSFTNSNEMFIRNRTLFQFNQVCHHV